MQFAQEALTFDDILLIPAYSEILPRNVELRSYLTREIKLNIPLASAAMDTVTEAGLAIALAEQGGIGIIHKNMAIEQQAREVFRVKKFESGVIKEPISVGPQTSIREVLELMGMHCISGVPVVEGESLVGIVTSRDLRFETRHEAPVTVAMTPKDRLITVREGAEREEVQQLLHQYRIEKLLVVNGNFQLRGMITVKDIQKAQDYPNACKDEHGRLRVGAAVGAGSGTQSRVSALVEAGTDVITVDTAHGHSRSVIEQIKWIKTHYPQVQIVAGNIATAEAARALDEAGADGVKVGIGPGSICTTRVISGVGMPQISAIINVAEELKRSGVPIIADGGIRFSGDVAKAIAAGAHVAMMGGMFAGTEEAPGDVELYQGRSYKSYRGMGSIGAMAQVSGSSDRYFQDSESVDKLVPEGIEGRVPYKGSLTVIVQQLMGGLRGSMGYCGCRNIGEFRTRTRFVRITQASVREGHVHDVNIVKEAPNYRID